MPNTQSKPITILLADDDIDDRLLTKDALRESHLLNELRCVGDGEELLEYLRRTGRYSNEQDAPWPGVILLDLNMPRKDGRETLHEIKLDPKLRRIPIVVLTTSQDESDVYESYGLGVNSFITKPVTFTALVEVVRTLGKYWFEIVELPGRNKGA